MQYAGTYNDMLYFSMVTNICNKVKFKDQIETYLKLKLLSKMFVATEFK